MAERGTMGKMGDSIVKPALGAAVLLLFLCISLPAGGQEKDVCVGCHQGMEGNLAEPVKGWRQSVHREVGITCKDCHGGNSQVAKLAKSKAMGYKGKPKPSEVPALCARCHSDVKRMLPYNQRTDQFAEYQLSIHGQRLAKGDTRVATCASCHGAHEVRRKKDPLAAVHHTRVPETCAKCHSDPKYMEHYKIPTDQLAEFRKSLHGQILLGQEPGKDPSLAPNCATCHGVHGATPPGVKEIAAVCSNCHTTIGRFYREGPHERAVRETGMPKCITCHGNHSIPHPTLEMLSGDGSGHCGSCHDAKSGPYTQAQGMKEVLGGLQRSIEGVQRGIEGLKAKHLEVSELEAGLAQAAGKLTQAKPMTHGILVAQIEELSAQGQKILQGMQARIAKFERDLAERKKVGLTLVTLIGLVVVFLYLKNESFKKRR